MVDLATRVQLAAADMLEQIAAEAPINESAIAQRRVFQQIAKLREAAAEQHEAQQLGAGQEGQDLVALFREAISWGRENGIGLQATSWSSVRDEMSLVFAARYTPAATTQKITPAEAPATASGHREDHVWCDCGDGYPSDSYGAGFIDAAGRCENCQAAEDASTEGDADSPPDWWPDDPKKVRDFVGEDLRSLSYGVKGENAGTPHEDDTYELLARDYMSAFACALKAAPLQALPAWWPDTPEKVRDFVGGNFCSLTYAESDGNNEGSPHSEDNYLVSAHDIMSQFSWAEWDVSSEESR